MLILFAHIQVRNSFADNAPSLNFTSIVGSISESAAVDSMVLDVNGRPIILAASDTDDGVNKLLSFKILESDARQYFEVLSSGSIRLRKLVDYESRKQFVFHVQVSDGGQPPLLSAESAKVTIDVINTNDCQPVFDAEDYNFTMTSPAFAHSVVGTVTAQDKDKLPVGELSYKLMSGNIDRLFHLNLSTGLLTLDRISNESAIRSLTVQAFDGFFTATSRIFVSFIPLASTGPKFASSLYRVFLAEKQSTGQKLLQLSLMDRYLNEQTHFQLLTRHSSFHLNSITGVLSSTGQALDHQLTPNITLEIEAVSLHQNVRRVARTRVIVDITDQNEAPSFSQPLYRIALPYWTAQHVPFFNITAIDKDDGNNATLTYSLVNEDTGTFFVDNTTGGLMLGKVLSQEQAVGKVLSIVIRATDHGQPALSCDTAVQVRIVSDTVPVFAPATYHVKIAEDLQIGSQVLSLGANYTSGNSSDVGREVVYAIISGDLFNNFDLDFHTGKSKQQTFFKLPFHRSKRSVST